MKRFLKKLSVIVLALTVLCVTFIPAFAETIYYDNGLLYTYLNNDEVTICGADDGVSEVVIPYYINYRYVVDIQNRAFMNNTDITSVDFTNVAFLRRIGSDAFSGCTNLSGEVFIPYTVTSFETSAFQDCSSLESAVIEAQNGEVPNQCFQRCSSLSSVTLNDSITRIGYYAFADCTGLTYLEIPASVTTIANSAFDNDADLTLGVYYGSEAYNYAVRKGFDYVVLDPENIPTEPSTEPSTEPATEPETQEPTLAPGSYMLGDADNSGYIDIVDATFVQRYATDINIPDEFKDGFETRADVDSMSGVDSVDATFIMRFIVHINTPYAIGEVFTA